MPAPPQEPREGYVAVGRVLRPWGLRGDLKVQVLTDFPERFEPGARPWLKDEERTVEQSRSQAGALYLKLAGIDDAADAERYRGLLLELPESALSPLDDDAYYHHQLIGLRVETTDGEDLGAVREVLPTGGNAVFVVTGPRGEVLIPFVEDVVTAVDLDAGRITVELIEGLAPERRERPPRAAPRRRWGGRTSNA